MDQVIGITRTRLNLREGPGLEYPVLEVLQKGARLHVLEDMGSWLNVQAGSRLGFVDERYVLLQGLDPEPLALPSPDFSASLTGTTTSRVNLREGPGLEYSVFQTVPPGTRLEIIEELGDWLNVFYDGHLAYVHEKFTSHASGLRMAPARPAPVPEREEGFEIWALVEQAEVLRTCPEDACAVLAMLERGEEVRVLEDMGAWLNVLAGDQVGFLHARAVKTVVRIIGVSTAVLNMRAGPGTQYSILNVLPLGAKVEILEDLGVWLDVRSDGMRGYVHGDFVRVADLVAPPDEPLSLRQGDRKEPAGQIPVQAGSVSWEQALLFGVWERHGRLLENLAGPYGLDPHVMASVLAVETAPVGFGADGRLLLRFENHIFWEFWGRQNPEAYARHFRFNPESPWQDHAFRVDAAQQRWKGVHAGGQATEWDAYQLALAHAKGAARCAVRMGAPGIPGYRHAELGYLSVDAMFEAFSESEENQVCGFFIFIRGSGSDLEGIWALREKDFLRFARFYNGQAQGEKYAAMLEKIYRLSRAL